MVRMRAEMACFHETAALYDDFLPHHHHLYAHRIKV